MADLDVILQQVHNALETVVSNNTSVTTPAEHVGVLNRTTDIVYPFFGFEWTRTPYTGYGGSDNQIVAAINYKNNGDIDSVKWARLYDLTVDIGVTVEGDFPLKRDQYLANVDSKFSEFVRHPDRLHADVSDVEETQALPSTIGDTGDSGVRTSYRIRYCSFDTEDVPAAESVNLDVDADGADAYPEHY